MTSGQPINLSYSAPSAFQVSTTPTYRPNYLGGSLYSSEKSVPNYFNKAAVVAPSTATPNDPSRPFGNLGRNMPAAKRCLTSMAEPTRTLICLINKKSFHTAGKRTVSTAVLFPTLLPKTNWKVIPGSDKN